MTRIVKLPVEAISIPEIRANSKLTPEQQEFFKATVEQLGVIQEPIVREISPGHYELIAGKTRLQELINQGHAEVDVKVVDADERTATFFHLAENLARGSVDIISVGRVMQKLHQAGTSITDLSRVLGKSETWVRRTLALLELPEQYQAAVSEGKLTPTHIFLAAKMPTPYEVDDALHTALTHGWNTTVFETFINNRLAELEAAKRMAVEKGVDYTPPPLQPEKLISYKQCLLCGYRVPADQIQVQLACEGCAELARYITSQLGPWDKCKDTVFAALQAYFGQPSLGSGPGHIPKTAAVPEKTVSEGQPQTPGS